MSYSSLDDYYAAMALLFGKHVADAVVKLNGICYCAQCEAKLMDLYNALIGDTQPLAN